MVSAKMKLHYDKTASRIKGNVEQEDRLLIRVQQKYDAKTHFEGGLSGIKSRTWNSETMAIIIPLEGGRERTLTFNDEAEFDAHRKNDIESVENKLLRISEEQLDLEEIYRRVFN